MTEKCLISCPSSSERCGHAHTLSMQSGEIMAEQQKLFISQLAELKELVGVHAERVGSDPLGAAAAKAKKRRPGGPSDGGSSAKKRRLGGKRGAGSSAAAAMPHTPKMAPMTSVKQVKAFLTMARKKSDAIERQTFCIALKDSDKAAKIGFVSSGGLDLLKLWVHGALESDHARLLGTVLKALMHLPITFTALKASGVARSVRNFSSSASKSKGKEPHADPQILRMADKLIVVWTQLALKFKAAKEASARGPQVKAAASKKKNKKSAAKAPSAAARREAKIAAREHEARRLEKERLEAARPKGALPKVSTAAAGPAAAAAEGGGSATTKKRRVSWAPEIEDVRPISPRPMKGKSHAKGGKGRDGGDFREALKHDKMKARELIDRELHKLPSMEHREDWTQPAKVELAVQEADSDAPVSKEEPRLARIFSMSLEVMYMRAAQVPNE